MKKISINDFKVTSKIILKECPSTFNLEVEEGDIKKELRSVRKKLGKLQDTLYAHSKYAVLVCLKGMDTSRNDSLISEVFNVWVFENPHNYTKKIDRMARILSGIIQYTGTGNCSACCNN